MNAARAQACSEDSSDSADSEDEAEVLKKTLSLYGSDLKESSSSFEDFLKGKDSSCLICLSGIRRVQAVWSCKFCYRIFHLVCIQQWAKDSVSLRTTASVLSEELFPNAVSYWSCPACRGEYSKVDTPQEYKCFCGKKVNPTSDPWLLAHSCGEMCGRGLIPACGHKCLALCHPGPCPPCPKTVSLRCHCAKSGAVPVRCGTEGWSCGKVCRKVLACGLHLCEETCHSGACGPCMVMTNASCRCSSHTEQRPCSDSDWSCGTRCGKTLACGHHVCAKICHEGDCGECPLQTNRTCPCGKTKSSGDCSTPVPCCGNTCSKLLSCGVHRCMRVCHSGGCGSCVERVEKVCRCGSKRRSVLCGQEFLCDSRCQNMRQCGRHQCRRKCCGGACPPCEQLCGRQLGCKNHKCSAPCHSGRCYPCVQLVYVTCPCDASKIRVACGRERAVKRPKCRQRCQKPSQCHHSNSHTCHEGDCPPCRQKCGKILTCQHTCAATCHSRPHLENQNKPVAPWQKKVQRFVVDECPPCMVGVSRSCLGGHEVVTMPCSQAAPYSCGRKCGRRLSCGNHTCSLDCHEVISSPDNYQAGENCLDCEEPCTKPRHKDCKHSCPLPCHSGDCPPCEAKLKLTCHCSSISLFINCREWCEANTEHREELRCCTSLCYKPLTCGHTCTKKCHTGPCTLVSECTRKIIVRCSCGRIKKDMKCNEKSHIACDKECDIYRIKKEKESAKAVENAKKKQEKEEQAMQEELERQLRPRKRKRKATAEDQDDTKHFKTTRYRLAMYTVLFILISLAILGMVYFMTQT